MQLLVLNAGSTSLKVTLYEMDTETRLARATVERVGKPDARVRVRGGALELDATESIPDVSAALARLLDALTSGGPLDPSALVAVGHRVVHGGEELIAPVRIDDAVKAAIARHARYAPLHNPANLAGIEAAQARLPGVPQVAVFDTAFHADLPEAAFLYGLPYEVYLQYGIRRYGFHGPSHAYMAQSASEFLGIEPRRLRLVTIHLGGGASVAAIEGGRSVDVSMGMTPLEGLLMGTRPGDLDPAVPLLLAREGRSLDAIETMLNKESGLRGLSGISDDFREVEAAATAGDPRAKLAVDVFIHRIRKYVGAYAAVLGGLDAIVFTGGIGENSARVRAAVTEGLVHLGVALDREVNDATHALDGKFVVDVSTRHAPTRVLVVQTDEEKMIARDVVRLVVGPHAARTKLAGGAIPIGVSVRHVHLSRAHCDALFGPGYELTMRRPVTQPGQFVCRETVDLVGPKGTIARVAIINPLRKETQVEVAKTDAVTLGVQPPLRESGKLEGTPGLVLRGPHGEVALDHGVILAQRHVHMSPDDATRFGVADGQTIKVRVEGDREAVLGDVLVRVRHDFTLDMHIDTDEANATALTSDSVVGFEGVQR